jgi:hypothetical protein
MANDTELKLTGKQKKFAEAYVICLNATEAASQAGYNGDRNTLRVIGSENLRKPAIRAYIDDVLSQQTLSVQEILGRLSEQARSDMGDFINDDSPDFDLSTIKKSGKSHLVKKIRRTVINQEGRTTEITEFELHDSQTALVHLGKAHGLFVDKVATTLKGDPNSPLEIKHGGQVGLTHQVVTTEEQRDYLITFLATLQEIGLPLNDLQPNIEAD